MSNKRGNLYTTVFIEDKLHVIIHDTEFVGTILYLKNFFMENEESNEIAVDYEILNKVDSIDYDSVEFQSVLREIIADIIAEVTGINDDNNDD